MTGYQETLTDPSYYGQIVTMTTPQIGNYGINDEDEESRGPKVAGFVIRELSPVVSNWRATGSLDEYLKKMEYLGSRGGYTGHHEKIRVHGALKACLSTEGLPTKRPCSEPKSGKGRRAGFRQGSYLQGIIHLGPSGEESRVFTVQGTTSRPMKADSPKLIVSWPLTTEPKKRSTKTCADTDSR